MATIPDYQTLMLPVLKASAAGERSVGDLIPEIAKKFNLEASQLEELLPSGKQSIIRNRIHWAKFYLTKAGLIRVIRRGVFTITPLGENVLLSSPKFIDNSFLKQFPDFVEFLRRSATAGDDSSTSAEIINVDTKSTSSFSLSPDERIETALQEMEAGIRGDLLARIFAIEPVSTRAKFFELLVIDLLKKMGFGKLNSKEAEHLGGTGDGGVDGVVHLDALGIDRVYVQAKCYDPQKSISAEQVQGFSGALDVKKTTRGVFITTAFFSKSAESFAANTQKQIVLIDGEELTNLMVKYGVGVRLDRAIEIKKIDEDYFET